MAISYSEIGSCSTKHLLITCHLHYRSIRAAANPAPVTLLQVADVNRFSTYAKLGSIIHFICYGDRGSFADKDLVYLEFVALV